MLPGKPRFGLRRRTVAIAYNQGNVFSNNTYAGTWNFTALDTGHFVSPSAWKEAPYSQDAGSSFGTP